MSLFNAFQSLWSSGSDASASDDASLPGGPAVNVDGTPMASDWIDVCGKPYGVVDFGDTSLSACETSSWSDSSSYLFSTGFSGSDEW